MPRRYREIYPSLPLLDSQGVEHLSAAALMSLQYFQAPPDTMPEDVFEEHHVLLNLKPTAQRVQNRRDGVLRDFTLLEHEVILTPAGMRSGWRWFETSDVIIITLAPDAVARFAEQELGLLLSDQQLIDLPQFHDPDLVGAGVMLRDTIVAQDLSSAVMFEAMARVFLVKLLQRFGQKRPERIARASKFTSAHHARVLSYIRAHLDQTITVDDLAAEVAMSPSHFARTFKTTMARSPMQFVMTYRIEQACKMMEDATLPLSAIAHACGFADQAHFSRSFKSVMGVAPRNYRAAQVA